MIRVGKLNDESTYTNFDGIAILCNIKGLPDTVKCVLATSDRWVNIDNPDVNICNIFTFGHDETVIVEDYIKSYEMNDPRFHNYRMALVYSNDTRTDFVLRELDKVIGKE